MISVIICSRKKELPTTFIDNVRKTIGVDFEFIVVDNSENNYSIFSAYNEGADRSTFPYLCFVHDDVLFHTPDWGKKIVQHLEIPKTGIIGLAGGDLMTRVPGSCPGKDSSVNIIQADKTGRRATEHLRYPENYNLPRRSTILLDGVLLCMKRSLMDHIRFDEHFGGFHGYDFDIAIQSIMAGYVNYVIYDIELEHASRGFFDAVYYRNQIRLFRKWESRLPVFGESISSEIRNNITATEYVKLRKLVRKMIKTGFSYHEIEDQLRYYAPIVGTPEALAMLKYLRWKLILKKLTMQPKYLFR